MADDDEIVIPLIIVMTKLGSSVQHEASLVNVLFKPHPIERNLGLKQKIIYFTNSTQFVNKYFSVSGSLN